MEDKKFCKYCGEKIDIDTIVCPKCGRQLKLVSKPEQEPETEEKMYELKVEEEINVQKTEKTKFYLEKWFMWLMLVFIAPVGIFLMWKYHGGMKKSVKVILSVVFGLFFILVLVSNLNNDDAGVDDIDNVGDSQTKITDVVDVKQVEVADFSKMSETEATEWCKNNGLKLTVNQDYSDKTDKGGVIKQSIKAGEKVNEGSSITITYSLGKEPSREYKNALIKAKGYAEVMNMSKQAIYDQLVSSYGEGFEKDAAQYAIDNLDYDWNKNALIKAKSYRDMMNMSKSAIYDQLISSYGEKFTKEEAQYAIDHLDD